MSVEKVNFYTKALKNFKQSTPLTLFSSFNSSKKKQKFIEGKLHICKFSNNLLFIDFGYKYEIEIFGYELNLRIPKINSITNQCNLIKHYSFIQFSIIIFHTFFLSNFVIKIKKEKLSTKILFYILLKQNQKRKKIFLKGRIIDIIKGGFSVGICGYVAFLPKSRASFKSLGKITFFYLLSINFDRKNFVVSQKNINKIIKRRLLKLGSRLVYIKHYKKFLQVDITQFG